MHFSFYLLLKSAHGRSSIFSMCPSTSWSGCSAVPNSQEAITAESKLFSFRKKSIVSEVKELMADRQYSICAACEKFGICHLPFFRWQILLPIALQVINKRKKKTHPGLSSILRKNIIISSSLCLMSELRDTGVPVNSKILQLEASWLSRKFCEKSKYSKQAIVRRFLKTLGLMNSKNLPKS